MSKDQDPIPLEIDAHAVKNMIDAGQPFLLIDCRRPEEYEFCRIEGSVHIPMQETPERLDELEPHREKPIVIQCHHGIRSLNVVHWLRQQGFSTAQSMMGGIDAWSQLIDPDVPTY